MYSEIEMTNKVKRNLCEIDLVAFFPFTFVVCHNFQRILMLLCHTYESYLRLLFCLKRIPHISFDWLCFARFSADKLLKEASQLHRETFIEF